MKNRTIRPAAVLGVLLCAFLPAKSQLGDIPQWRIEVQGPNLRPHSLSAQLYDTQNHKVAAADLTSDDAFLFRNVATGQYWVVVNDTGGTELYKGLLSASPIEAVVAIHLPEDDRRRPPSGPVSVTELRHPPSAKAIRAATAAQHSAESGDYRKAAQQLENAIRMSPDYAVAHSNLGAQYARMGRYDDAITEARQSIALGQPNPVDLCNMAYAQLFLRRFDDAGQSVRQCLALAPSSPHAHYLLGNLLARESRTLPEALAHLEFAARSLPQANREVDAVRRALANR